MTTEYKTPPRGRNCPLKGPSQYVMRRYAASIQGLCNTQHPAADGTYWPVHSEPSRASGWAITRHVQTVGPNLSELPSGQLQMDGDPTSA